ncbi:MAG: protoporphyrinogen oxidase [Planctomycetota bacterium]
MNASPDPSKPRRVAVIGAGLSGLATSFYLKRLGADVTVLEASERVGGVIHTEHVDVAGVGRFVIDHGADMFATNPRGAIELCRDLGVEAQLQRPKSQGRGAMIAKGNQLIPIPAGFVLMRATRTSPLLRTPLLSIGGKLRWFAERFVTPRDSDVEDESVGDFVRRRMGRQLLDRLVAPLVAGIYTADVDRLSMAATMKPIWEMETKYGSLSEATRSRRKAGDDATEQTSSGARYEQFRAFPGGMTDWMNLLVHAIGEDHVHLFTAITQMRSVDNGIHVHDDHDPFDDVVLALPAHGAARLLRHYDSDVHRSIATAAADELDSIRMASTAIVVLGVRRSAISRMPSTFGFVVPPREGRRILAGSFASEKFEGRAPDDHVVIRAFVGGMLHPEVLDQTDSRLVDLVRRELHDLIGLDGGRPLDEIAPLIRVIRWNQAMPQYEVGHLRRATRVHEAIGAMPRIHLAGNGLDGVGIAPVIGRAKQLAAAIVTESDDSPSRP